MLDVTCILDIAYAKGDLLRIFKVDEGETAPAGQHGQAPLPGHTQAGDLQLPTHT